MGKRVKHMDNTLLQFNIELIGADLEDWEKLNFSAEFLPILRDCDQVEKADYATSTIPDPDARPFLDTLAGVLLADVKLSNLKPFLKFLGNQLQNQQLKNQQVKLSIKIGKKEKEVIFEAKSLTDTEFDRWEKMLSNIISDIS